MGFLQKGLFHEVSFFEFLRKLWSIWH